MLENEVFGRSWGEGEKERREKIKKISTRLLTVLITSVIVRIEQRKEILHPRSFCSERMLAFDR